MGNSGEFNDEPSSRSSSISPTFNNNINVPATKDNNNTTLAALEGDDGQERPPLKKELTGKYLEEVKDLQNSGSWGKISKREKWIMAGVVAIVVVGTAILVLVLFLTRDTAAGTQPEEAVSPAPQAPTSAPTHQPPTTNQDQWSALRDTIEGNDIVKVSSAEVLEETLTSLQGKHSDPFLSPQVRAASWLIFEDRRQEHHESGFLRIRYALAVLYYALNGSNWNKQDNWMTDTRTCDWSGVSCELPLEEKVVTLDLSNNNLTGGPIPEEINLLQNLVSLFLANNKIEGTIPAVAIGSIPSLAFLYLNNNELTGEILPDLRANDILHTLYLQENDLTGEWPFEFCSGAQQSVKVREFGLDCDKLQCYCCDSDSAKLFDPCY